jgi:ABC-type polysaccharide/polyol phosphate export permease
MAFFSGTFFPIDRMPEFLRTIIYIFPLTHTNIVIRQSSINEAALESLAILVLYAIVFFIIGSRLISNYSE